MDPPKMDTPNINIHNIGPPNVDLESVLNRLGMQCYLHRFMNTGFDSWGVVKDITEKDMQVLGFQLGHIRKLQREIATSRGWPQNVPLKATCVCCGGRKDGEQKVTTMFNKSADTNGVDSSHKTDSF
ncbi:hypothetical protein OCU04_008300 [Sclerotinia nivalis]|uniref:SAM domain-containing protein n=1 Tax=Sclerotinia nivalis TaxID=352851 RepID=A0A9X0AHS9_9HELO|nr:hypothetical protein OCU04_008300 [Sclerotinia nivalis]